MAKNVQARYRKDGNLCITKSDSGQIEKVTVWKTGIPGSTERF